MKRLAEAILFTSLAAGLHLAVFWARPADDGPSAGGVGGAADITLAGAAPETVALVAEWERTPEIAAPPAASRQTSPGDRPGRNAARRSGDTAPEGAAAECAAAGRIDSALV